MQTSISNPKFITKEVGKLVKSSKVVFTWEFTLESTTYRIDFYFSKSSNKRRICLNGNKILETKDYSKDFKFNFVHKDKMFSIFQVGLRNFDLSINDIIFSRLLEGDRPSPEASVRQNNNNVQESNVQIVEEVKYDGADYPELPSNVFESIVQPEALRQSIIDDLFGDSPSGSGDKFEKKTTTSTFGNGSVISTASASNIINSHSDIRTTNDFNNEESKDNNRNEMNMGFDFVKITPQRSNTAMVLNLLEFEPIQPKRQLSDLLGEIDFTSKPKMPENKQNEMQQKPHHQAHPRSLDVIFKF
jgi:hypothetical protein